MATENKTPSPVAEQGPSPKTQLQLAYEAKVAEASRRKDKQLSLIALFIADHLAKRMTSMGASGVFQSAVLLQEFGISDLYNDNFVFVGELSPHTLRWNISVSIYDGHEINAEWKPK